MATENAPNTVHRVKVGPSEAKCCESARQDNTHREKLKHTCLTYIMKPANSEDVRLTKNLPKENQEGTVSHKLTGHPVKVGPSEVKFCEPVLQGDTHRKKLKDTCTTNIIKPVNPEDVQQMCQKKTRKGLEVMNLQVVVAIILWCPKIIIIALKVMVICVSPREKRSR
uniref:Uncharacterized protein n=1 Tax=Solanum tuberosum TaxID=4113 RepID=M1CRZ5_SOLTU